MTLYDILIAARSKQEGSLVEKLGGAREAGSRVTQSRYCNRIIW